jgi:hypothetical protein
VKFKEALSETFVAKSSRLELGMKHNPIAVGKQVGNGVPHLLQPPFGRWLLLENRAEHIHSVLLLFTDYGEGTALPCR